MFPKYSLAICLFRGKVLHESLSKTRLVKYKKNGLKEVVVSTEWLLVNGEKNTSNAYIMDVLWPLSLSAKNTCPASDNLEFVY